MGYLPRGQSLTSSITFVLLIVNAAVFIITLIGETRSCSFSRKPVTCSSLGTTGSPSRLCSSTSTSCTYCSTCSPWSTSGPWWRADYSRTQYISVYFAAGLLGNLASLFLIPLDAPTGGASGAIFGLLGAYVAMERRGTGLVIAVLYAGLIFIDNSGPGVNIFAHLFGVLTGFGLGLFFAARNRSHESYSSGGL